MTTNEAGTNPIDPATYSPLHGKRGLIDGDIIVYRCAFAAEKNYYLLRYADGSGSEYGTAKEAKDAVQEYDGSTIWTRKEIQPVGFACQAAKTTVEAIFRNSMASSLSIYLSGKSNFRDDIAVTRPYKGNRDSVAKPTHWRAVRDYLRTVHGAITTDGYEADDAIGIESTRDRKGTFICTIDKDLDQIPGLHYNWVSGEVYDVTPKEADFNLYRQILSGDSTDNVPGLEGIGAAKAGKALSGCKSSVELFRRTWGMYSERLSGVGNRQAWDYFLEQANLLYILRDGIARYTPLEYPL